MAQWTKERNQLQVETVESIIYCKFNYKMTCSEFHMYAVSAWRFRGLVSDFPQGPHFLFISRIARNFRREGDIR